MGFTVVGWYQNIDTNGNLTPITALADQHVRVQGNDIIVPREYNKLLAVYGQAQNLTGVQMVSPSIRRMFNLDVFPFWRFLSVTVSPPVWRGYDISHHPIALQADEALEAWVAEDGTGAGFLYVFAWLGDAPRSPVEGDIFTIKATSTTAAVPNQWTAVTLSFSQSLPAGEYEIVGSYHSSVSAIVHRYVFVGGIWRPGAISGQSLQDFGPERFRHGNFGSFGTFRHNTPPQVEVLCASSDASHTFYLDLIKRA